MKKIILIFIILFSIFSSNLTISRWLFPNLPNTGIAGGELIIYNQKQYFGIEENDAIKIRIYPVGTIFNGINSYSKYASHVLVNNDSFITGKEIIIEKQPNITPFTSIALGNFDNTGIGNSMFSFGFNKFKIEFYKDSVPNANNWKLVNYVILDFSDTSDHREVPYNNLKDIRIDYFHKDLITFQHYPYKIDSAHYFYNIDTVNHNIKMWDLYGTFIDPYSRYRGLMKSDSSKSGEFLNWPINANLYNGNIGHDDPGFLSMNLEIQNSHYARINRGIPFTVNDSAKLSLKHSDTYENNARLYVVNNSLFSVKPTATLEINKYGNVIIDSGGVMNMEENSNIIFRDHGEIIIESGGTLNDCRAFISYDNSACTIINHGGTWNVGAGFCDGPTTRIINSGGFLIENGGDLRIGDSSKIVFDGASSFLRINPQSKIFLGENASI